MSALDLGLAEEAASARQGCHRDGLWMEFGVYRGRSIAKLRHARETLLGPNATAVVYGFDSFRGLPETWRRSWGKNGSSSPSSAAATRLERRALSKGAFDLRGRPPYRREGIVWVQGWFHETIPSFLRAHATQRVDFVHVDSDLFSSAATVLTSLGDRLSEGTILVFDELINYPEFRDGELRALCEWIAASGRYGLKVLGTGASIVLPDAERIRDALHATGGDEMPHTGPYRQDAAFVLWEDGPDSGPDTSCPSPSSATAHVVSSK